MSLTTVRSLFLSHSRDSRGSPNPPRGDTHTEVTPYYDCALDIAASATPPPNDPAQTPPFVSIVTSEQPFSFSPDFPPDVDGFVVGNVGGATASPPCLHPAGILPHSHESCIHNAILCDLERSIPVVDPKRLVITLLLQKSAPKALLDSSDRYPPPRCHPGTREKLRARMFTWLANPARDSKVIWLMGPAGVGKTAVAQTVAEDCKANGRLGAAFFFSRPNHHDDLSCVIPTIAYQLAVREPVYKHLMAQRLANDPSILGKDIRSQFKELIVEPIKALEDQGSVKGPLLIVLDGLDACTGKEDQRDFVGLISKLARAEGSTLVWMICSRPELHLKQVLSNAGCGLNCRREELVIDDEEARHDVYRFLRDKFDDVRRRMRGVPPGQWPSDSPIRQLSRAASGFFSFATAMLEFIEDKTLGDPMSQLSVSLKAIASPPALGANPLRTLDLLYKQVLDGVSPHSLPILMRILYLRILCPGSELSVRVATDILGLDQASFYAALKEVYSVLHIPIPEDVDKEGIHFYHTSFKTFLTDENRSGSFSVPCNKAHYNFVVDRVLQHNVGSLVLITPIIPGGVVEDSSEHADKPQG